ncbi:MAG TPA: MFS transporter [Gaiellaceae bacterium]|nr:MFS transporter [Gaiellaceae bacterium]
MARDPARRPPVVVVPSPDGAAAAAIAAAAEPRGRARLGLLATIASGTLLNPLNSSMIAVALVDLARHFRLDFSTASWLISAYYLASAVGQPLSGRLADLHGRKRIFLAGLALVGLASIAAPFAPSFAALVAVRVVQAAGSSALYPAGLSILRSAIRERQTSALGVLSVFASVSAAVGPTLGGYLVGWQGWRAIFVVNLPLVALALALAARVLPADPPRSRTSLGGELRRLDPAGAVLFAAALVSLLWFLLSLDRGVAWWALPLALAAGATFAHVERRTPEPFLDVRTLAANRQLLRVYAQFALVNVVFYSVFFGVPSFLQEAKGLSAEQAGLVILPIAGVGVLTTPLAARAIERSGPRPAVVAGSLCMTAGTLALLAIGKTTSDLATAGLLALLGVSSGLNNLGLQAAMVEAAPHEQIGSASGLFQTSRYLGTILSASLLGLAFGQRIDANRLHTLSIALAVLSGLIVLFTLWGRGDARR